jgi:hypothetical protein
VASILSRLSGGVERTKLSLNASRNGNLALIAARSWSDNRPGLFVAGSRQIDCLWWEVSSRMRLVALCCVSRSSAWDKATGKPAFGIFYYTSMTYSNLLKISFLAASFSFVYAR